MIKKLGGLLLILLLFAGCTQTSLDDNFIYDPFLEQFEQTQNTNEQQSIDELLSHNNPQSSITPPMDTLEAVRDYIFSLATCSVAMTVNDEKLIYDGEPVKVMVTLKTDESNNLNCSCGISVFINGLAQEVSTDGVNYDYIAVYKELEQGNEYEAELYFKPSILLEDKDKNSLEVSFVQCSNVHYKPSRLFLTLFGTHDIGFLRIPIEMIVNKRITNIVECKTETEFTSRLITKPTNDISDFVPNNLKDGEYGLLYLSENGSLSATFSLQNTSIGTHRLALFVNDKPVTFNGGKSFCDIEVKPQTQYLLEITLDEDPDELDYVYMLDFHNEKRDSEVTYTYASSGRPKIIVAHDFVR